MIDIGEKCLKNWYEIVTQDQYQFVYGKAILDYSRWLYVLGAFQKCLATIDSFMAQQGDLKLSLPVQEGGSREQCQLAQQIRHLWLRASSKLHHT